MGRLRTFTDSQLAQVEAVTQEARELVGDYYALAPREWARLENEVRTLVDLAPTEVTDQALAQVLCYEYTRQAGNQVIARGDLYRICLQDHRILNALERGDQRLDLAALLLYVITHEFVHVVRFGVRLQDLHLPPDLRPLEEQNVDKITRRILTPIATQALHRVVGTFC